MKYLILCAGTYTKWETPRQLIKINGEPIVKRTIRLLMECGVDKQDIGVTASKDFAYDFMRYCDWVCFNNKNTYTTSEYNECSGHWCDCFYQMSEPCTYIFGDVVFSPDAIKKIVETKTNDIEFFASAPPFAKNYSKEWAEPFAFKVENQDHLREAKAKVKQLEILGKFKRKPIAWEFWQVVKDTPINEIDYTNYTAINDYTCDIDTPEDIKFFEGVI